MSLKCPKCGGKRNVEDFERGWILLSCSSCNFSTEKKMSEMTLEETAEAIKLYTDELSIFYPKQTEWFNDSFEKFLIAVKRLIVLLVKGEENEARD